MIEWNGFVESQLSSGYSPKRIVIIRNGKTAVDKVLKKSSKRKKKNSSK